MKGAIYFVLQLCIWVLQPIKDRATKKSTHEQRLGMLTLSKFKVGNSIEHVESLLLSGTINPKVGRNNSSIKHVQQTHKLLCHGRMGTMLAEVIAAV